MRGYGVRDVDQPRRRSRISAEHAAARRAYDFIARVRNEAHFATGRRTDLLSLDLQPALASGLGYVAKRGIIASELFMRDYYRRAQELRGFRQLRAAGRRPAPRPSPLRASTQAAARGRYEVRDGRLLPRAAG